MHVLVTRPEPAAAATAARLRAIGHAVTVAPLLRAAARGWAMPDVLPAAVAFTSANGVELAGAAVHRLTGLPAFAIGAATANAARTAGFGDVRDGGGTATALFAAVAAAGFGDVLHLAGEDRTAVTVPPGLWVAVRTVYAAVPVALPAAALDTVDAVLLYSARTAAQFAAEATRLGVDRAIIRLAALSPAVAAAAGPGWGGVAVAAAPTEDALFAAAGRLCDKRAVQPRGGS